jgi:hypothetical protein
MKMAKASEADMRMAMELVAAFDLLGQRFYPCMPEAIEKPDDDCESERFDRDDDAQCGRAMRHLLDLTGSASLSRVIYGMAVLLDPANRCVDPNLDYIEHHPLLMQAVAATQARPLSDWHEDIGPVLWWTFPVQESPWSGQPLDDDWPHYHTHWTPLMLPEAPAPAPTETPTTAEATP